MISGRDFLTLAELWVKGTSEAEWRSAISRAYYAAFHAVRQFLEDLGFVVPRGEQAHGNLWLRLSNCGDHQLQIAGSRLSVLRGQRNRSDYELNLNVHQASALVHVQGSRPDCASNRGND